jgi:hypothetical protein
MSRGQQKKTRNSHLSDASRSGCVPRDSVEDGETLPVDTIGSTDGSDEAMAIDRSRNGSEQGHERENGEHD